MMRTAATRALINPCIGRQSAAVQATSTKAAKYVRGLAAHAASNGGDHHHHDADHHYTPPFPPFARLPVPSQKLYESHDAVFDDGVAPELALDFDAQNVSSREALACWLGAFGLLALLYQCVKVPGDECPAVRPHNLLVQTLPYDMSDVANLHAIFPNHVSSGHDADSQDEEGDDEADEDD